MKRKLFMPLLLLVTVSMLAAPVARAQPQPFGLDSEGYGKLRTGYNWFWSKYCIGCATFEYAICPGCGEGHLDLDVFGRYCSASAWWEIKLENPMKNIGCLYTFKISEEPATLEGVDIGGVRVVLLVTSEVGEDGSVDEEASGLVFVYGCGAYYVGRITSLVWYIPYFDE